MIDPNEERAGLAWQTGVWNRISTVYLREIDRRFAPVVEALSLGFDFPDFTSAWNTLAGVTTAQLPAERQREAKDDVMAALYPDGDGRRHFRNGTRFIVGRSIA